VGVPKSILGRYAPTAHIEDESAVFVTLSGIAANDNTWAQIEDMWRGILSDHNPKAEYMHMVFDSAKVSFFRQLGNRSAGLAKRPSAASAWSPRVKFS